MVFLLLAVVSSASVSLALRFSEGRAGGGAGMLACNYLTCLALAALFAGRGALAPGEGRAFAAGLGAVNGALYLASFLLLRWNVRVNGVALPATFMKLGVLVPTLTACLVFGETPTAAQAAGVALALAAILLMRGGRDGGAAGSRAGLLLLLLGGGMADATSKIYEEMGEAAYADLFLLSTFLSALSLCALLCAARRQGVSRKDALYGALVGVPNYFSARFLLLSLSSVPAVVAYPAYSVGTIVVVTLAGRALFGERLTRRALAAVGIILAALLLLNL